MNSNDEQVAVDVLIVGAGIAGLWSANVLCAAGYSVLVTDPNGIGGTQSLASQGLIHGGIKYALGGFLTGASNAIADMPRRWRECLSTTEGPVDLTSVTPVAQRYLLFSADSARSRLSTFLAGQALRGDVSKLAKDKHPAALRGFSGSVFELPDLVLDTRSVADSLARNGRFAIYEASTALTPDSVRINGVAVAANVLVCCAGSGNEALIQQSGVTDLHCQRRPLQQVIVRADNLPLLFGHCVTGIRRPEPRLTITSHDGENGRSWYIGGQLATDGASLPAADLISHARSELAQCLPWIDLENATFETLLVDRAEPANDGVRPDEAVVQVRGNRIFAWPTKLSLAPDLGDQVLTAVRAITPPSISKVADLPLPRAAMATRPW
ncbi:MAG: FAD-dependent oxidoreductase [Pseudomonadaceae bacterium]|nr:FAD-dependent oxidoreductase [Pseudomonadaceae bacterium]